MTQVLQVVPSVKSIGANETEADTRVASNGQFPTQPNALAEYTARVKAASSEEDSLLDGLPIEHPLTIAYVSSCQPDNHMIYVSPQIESLGFTAESWLGGPNLRLQHIHKEDVEQVEKAMWHSFRTAAKLSCIYRLHDSAGDIHWFQDEASVMCDESGNPLFLMGAMRDITEMKTMEAELNEHRYYLERKVEQRTEQLVTRITLLESCNATLCNKLAQARGEIAALHKQLAGALSGLDPSDCLEQITCINDGLMQRIESDIRDGWLSRVASA